MPRPPRNDVERAARYVYKLIPQRVGDSIEGQLPAMQSEFSTWAQTQAQLYAIISGVLSGYSVPSTQYVRYYAWGLQVHRITRRFGSSPSAAVEIIARENTWLGRGYNIIILDAVRDSVILFASTWSVIPTAFPGQPSVNTISGMTAWGGAYPTDQVVILLDPRTRIPVYVPTTDTNPAVRAHCSELDRCYFTSSISDIIASILEAATPVNTEQPLAAGDAPNDIAIDYDPAKWADPVFGYAWVPCHGHAKTYKWRLDGSVSPTPITMAANCNYAAVDQAMNKVYVSASGTPKIYVIDRDTNAINVKTAPHNCQLLALDPVAGELWISGEGNSFVMKMDTTTFGFTSYATPGPPTALAIDPIRRKAYVACVGFAVITVINGATGASSTIPCTVSICGLAVDPVACFLLWSDDMTGNVQRVHLLSLLTHDYPLGDQSYGVAINPSNHSAFINNYVPAPGGNHTIWCILP